MRHGLAAPFLLLALLIAALPAGAQDIVTATPALREVTLTGFTRARHVMQVVSEESGRCRAVAADVGEELGKDGVFASLDTTFIDLEIRANRAEENRLNNQIAYIAKEAARFRELVSRQTAAQSELDKLEQELDQARLRLESLRIEADNLAARKERFIVRAKPGWKVISREVEPGAWVERGKTLGSAGDYRVLLVPLALSPAEYARLREKNGELTLRMPDIGAGGMNVKSRIERVSPDFDPETRKINLDLAVQGLPEMRGGLRAELSLSMPDDTGAVILPRAAVLQRYEEFLVQRENGEHVRVVVLGDAGEGLARVRGQGLAPGQSFRLSPSL